MSGCLPCLNRVRQIVPADWVVSVKEKDTDGPVCVVTYTVCSGCVNNEVDFMLALGADVVEDERYV